MESGGIPILKAIILYFQLFTAIPLPWTIDDLDQRLRQGVVYLPLYAGIYALILTLCFGFMQVFFTHQLAWLLLLLLDVLLTRAFHYDALADTADGLFSSRQAQEMLTIMKDSRIGVNGVLALIFYFLLMVNLGPSWGQELATKQVGIAVWAWAFVGRSLLPISFYHLKYVGLNPQGLGALFTQVATWQILVSQGLVLVILAMIKTTMVWAYSGTILCALAYRHFVVKRLGGMTGDTMGALVLVGQVVFGLLMGWLV